ncbi:hypothetical protein pb186bvf_002466 [Paramecium bursaria]
MFSQQFSIDNSGSNLSSQQSQTFLTVPRVIQQPIEFQQGYVAYQKLVQKQVNFEDLSQLKKSEHKESLEEGDLGAQSRQSFDRKDQINEVEEQYKSLKLFQIEMQNVQGKRLISKGSRKFSDGSDLFTNQAGRKQSDQQKVIDSISYSPKFKAQQNSPLLVVKQDFPYEYNQWPRKLLITMRFVSKLLQVFPKKMKQRHILLVNDRSSNIYNNPTLNVWDPDNSKIIIYRQIIAIINIALIFFVLLSMCYEIPYILEIFFSFNIIDTCINYNIGYYENEILETNRIKIVKKYMVIDLIVLISILISMILEPWFMLMIIVKNFKQRNYLPQQLRDLFNIISLIHWITCIQIKLADQLYYQDVFDQYVDCLQWALSQLLHSGYTEILAISNVQKLFTIFVNIIGLFLIIYIIKTNLHTVSQKQINRDLSNGLNQKIQRYLNKKPLQACLIPDLRVELKQQFKQEQFIKHLKNLPFSEEFKLKLTQKVKTKVLDAGEIIVKEKQVAQQYIIFLQGQFQSFKGKTLVCKNNFPLNLFYKQGQHFLSIKCETQCLIGIIEMEDFLEEIRKFDKDFQKFCMLRDDKKQYCECCGYRGHSVEKCRFVYFTPNYRRLIKKHNYCLPENRRIFLRNVKDNKINALMNKNLICITAISYAITNKLRSENELTNEVMGWLQGSTNNIEDSILQDFQEERSSRYSLYQRAIEQSNGKGLSSPQNSLSSQNLQQMPPIKLDDRESSQNSRKIHGGKFYDHTQSINSIKVNLVKSSVSNDQKMRAPIKKATNSSSSANKRIMSTSIMQMNKSSSNTNQHPEKEQPIDIDQVCSYEYYYPSYNIEKIALKLNNRRNIRSVSFT